MRAIFVVAFSGPSCSNRSDSRTANASRIESKRPELERSRFPRVSSSWKSRGFDERKVSSNLEFSNYAKRRSRTSANKPRYVLFTSRFTPAPRCFVECTLHWIQNGSNDGENLKLRVEVKFVRTIFQNGPSFESYEESKYGEATPRVSIHTSIPRTGYIFLRRVPQNFADKRKPSDCVRGIR